MTDSGSTPRPDAPIRHDLIQEVLEGRAETTVLTEAEGEIWTAAFCELMGKPSEKEIAFFEDLKRRGRGVGLDEDGNLVWAKPEGQT